MLFTEEAVREAKRWVRRYKRKHPKSTIVVTGCAAQIEGGAFSNLKEADLVVANTHKAKLSSLLSSPSHKVLHSAPVFKNKWPDREVPSQETGHSRLFLKIQDGCNSFCTFCVIPYARGKSRSLPPHTLIQSINEHHHVHKVQEVVLTGVHIGDYRLKGQEEKDGLSQLVKLILEHTDIPRIRLSSLEPPELTNELMDMFCSSNRMCPHFHLSIQNLNTDILKRMKRHYTYKDIEHCLLKIEKRLKSFVGMDLITGFPGETKDQFEDSWLKLKNLPWTKLHVFPYSPRPYTLAGRSIHILNRGVIMKRSSHLRSLSQHRYMAEAKKQMGCLKMVLPLKKIRFQKKKVGISLDYWHIEMRGENMLKKDHAQQMYKVCGFDPHSGHLRGEQVNQ